MNPLDMRTVIFSYVISNAICAIVMTILWLQNRKRFAGLGFWLADFGMQFAALALVILRGAIPDLVSMVGSNVLVIGGTILLYMGLERFTGKRGPQIHNALLLLIFILVHAYFAVIQPSVQARNINLSLALLLICFQCAWLMLRRVAVEMRPSTRGVGIVFIVFCVVSVVRIVVDLAVPPAYDFFRSDIYETLVLLAYQMLFITLTFGLSLLVSRRLLVDLERDIAERQQVEETLRLSEEKYSKAFHSSPDAVLITRLVDGRIIEVNEGFSRITGYSREEALASSTLALNLWASLQDRSAWAAALRENRRVHNVEYDFVGKSGQRIRGLYSGEIIVLDGEAHALSIVRDITERKQAEAALQAEKEFVERALNTQLDTFFVFDPQTGKALRWNRAFRDMSGYSDEEIAQLKAPDAYYAPAALEQATQAIQSILERGAGTIELEFICKDGKKVPLEYIASVMYNAAGEPSLISIGRNITERKRVEEILRLRLRLWEYANTHSVEELMQMALDEISVLMDSPIGFYHFVEEDQITLSLQAWSTRTLAEFCQAEGRSMHYPISEAGVWVDCVRQRQPVIHNDFASLPHRKGFPAGHAEVIRELVVPTMRGDRIVSILGIGNRPANYVQQDIEVVSYIADVIWTIVEQKRANEQVHQLNARLEQLVMTDELTHAGNRRGFFTRGHEEIERTRRYQTPLSLMMLDIDEFKRVNDTCGHDAGDLVLQCVAKTIQQNIRETDMLARLGGEEFGILLPNTTTPEAGMMAERLREMVEKETCSNEDHRMGVTVSIGVAGFDNSITNIDHLLKNADAAMYRAKSLGRNRVVSLG